MDKRILRNKEKYEGQTFTNRYGHTCVVLEYRGTFDVTIAYPSGVTQVMTLAGIKAGDFKDRDKPSILGVGINDADYVTQPTLEDGTRTICPIYQAWKNMLTRCYCEQFKAKQPVYKDCTCDVSWLRFSTFKAWVDSLPYKISRDMCLDKDILNVGNKHYSPENCAFVDNATNVFVITCRKIRGKYPLGVYFKKAGKKNRAGYVAKCHEAGMKDSRTLGTFDTPLEAHKAWQTRKHELACELAKTQPDPRVAKALRERYAPDKDWSKY